MDSTSVAQFVAVPTAFLLGGYHFALSQNAVPVINGTTASISAPLFRRMYFIGLKQFFLPTAVTSFMSFNYLAYCNYARNETAQSAIYGAAAGLVLGVGLTTKLVMLPGVERLLAITEDAGLYGKASVQAEITRLLSTWAVQNWLRAALGTAAGIVGMYAIILSVEKSNEVI